MGRRWSIVTRSTVNPTRPRPIQSPVRSAVDFAANHNGNVAAIRPAMYTNAASRNGKRMNGSGRIQRDTDHSRQRSRVPGIQASGELHLNRLPLILLEAPHAGLRGNNLRCARGGSIIDECGGGELRHQWRVSKRPRLYRMLAHHLPPVVP